MGLTKENCETNAVTVMEQLLKELPGIQENSSHLRTGVLNYCEEIYENMISRPKAIQFLRETEKLINTADELHSTTKHIIEAELIDTTNEIVQAKNQVKAIDENLQICNDISKLNLQLSQLKALIKSKAYIQASELLLELQTTETKQDSKVIYTLQKEIAECESTFIKLLHGLITDELAEYSTSQEEDTVKFWLKFGASKLEKGCIQEAITAVTLIDNNLMEQINKLTNFIWDSLVAIVKTTSNVQRYDNECTITTNAKYKATYQDVLNNLLSFYDFLKDNLNYHIHDHMLMDYITENLPGDVAQLIITFCLEDTIPNSEEGLENFPQVIKEVDILENQLVAAGLLDSQSRVLLDYVSNVQEHFAYKESQKFNKNAIDLMKKDLHNIVLVGQAYDSKAMSVEGFPQCAVSKSVLEFLQLIQTIIKTAAKKQSETLANQYLTTAAALLDKYPSTIEEFHQSLLKTIPQQGAIFYNNCKYIAYEVNSVSWQELLQELRFSLRRVEEFSEVGQGLNTVATKMMQAYVQEQVNSITTRINESGIHLASENCDQNCEKTIRQCLRQQELLKTVWQKVLNYYEYNKTMGILLDALCTSIVLNVLKIEDIAADVADHLVDMIKVVLTRGPKLFTEPKEILMYVKNWDKLSELVFVLNSGLESIDERWADGKGPLALYFSSEELRALIRALFQNSSKRAALLSKIC